MINPMKSENNSELLNFFSKNLLHKYRAYSFVSFMIISCMALAYASDALIVVAGVLTSVIIVLVIFFDLFGAFCLLLFIMPFSLALFKFEIGPVTFNPFNFGVISILVVYVVLSIFQKRRFNLGVRDIVLFALCFSFLYSTLQSDNIFESGRMAFEALLIPAGIYLVFKVSIRNKREYDQALSFLLLGLTIFAVICVAEYVVNPIRSSVLSVPPISAATLLFASLSAFFYLPICPRFFRIICATVNLIAFFTCMARVYTLVFLVSYFLKLIISYRKAAQLLLVFLICTLSGTLILAHYHNPKMQRTSTKKENLSISRFINPDHWIASLNSRGGLYKDGLKFFLKNSTFGIGYHRSDFLASRHNIHVEWLEYGGLIGYMLYALFLYLHFHKLAPYAKNPYITLNLLIIFSILANAVTNSFVLGFVPLTAFIFMGFNEAWLRLIEIEELDV